MKHALTWREGAAAHSLVGCPDDFRAEILELMQTQMIKNALIAPQGAKGGFVLKTSARTQECARLGKTPM